MATIVRGKALTGAEGSPNVLFSECRQSETPDAGLGSDFEFDMQEARLESNGYTGMASTSPRAS